MIFDAREKCSFINLNILFTGIITFVNCASVKWAARMQIVFTAAKMIAIVMLIVTGIVRIAQGKLNCGVHNQQSCTKMTECYAGSRHEIDGIMF